jgi:hypothetical protein
MTDRPFGTLAALVGLGLLAGCATTPRPSIPPCQGYEPPQLLAAHPITLPPTYITARMGEAVVSEVVVGSQGEVVEVRPWRNLYKVLAPYAERSLRKSRFAPATIEGNPVASRCLVTTAVGTVRPPKSEPSYDTLWVYTAGGESREALWQLRGSVRRITVKAHVGSPGTGTEVVARNPSGEEKVLLRKTVSAPADFQETVRTGDFLEGAGDYRLELRVGGRTVAGATFTVAEDAKDAIVNACEPLPRKK